MENSFKAYGEVKFGKYPFVGDWVILGYKETKDFGALLIGDNCVIRSHTVIYGGNVIGDNFKTGHHVFIREHNTIGSDVSIGTGSVIEHHITIKDKVRIHSQVFIPEYSLLEEGVWVGPNVVVTNAKYPNAPDTKDKLKGVTLQKGAKVGANATLLPGICVGENALVGAGSVVAKDVAPNTVVAGVPARVIGEIDNIASYSGIINNKQ